MEMHRDWGITPGEGGRGRGEGVPCEWRCIETGEIHQEKGKGEGGGGRGCRVKGDAEPVHISHKDWGIAGEGEGVHVKGDAEPVYHIGLGNCRGGGGSACEGRCRERTERMGRGREWGRESGDAWSLYITYVGTGELQGRGRGCV